MVNLAGVKSCDETIEKELQEAGIEILHLRMPEHSEVPANIVGKCNNFIFTRAWRYWVVNGYMPLEYAIEMYDKYKDLMIRVGGHAGNMRPEKWARPKDFEKRCIETLPIENLMNGKISGDAANKVYSKIRKEGDQFIRHYHIDTQEGLNQFVKMIKDNNIFG